MKRLLLILPMLLLPLLAIGQKIIYEGLKYEINTSNHTASVAAQGRNAVSGDITIPSSITYDGYPYTVTSIGNGAFRNCDELTSISIPNSVTSIGERAFFWCRGLESIAIPNSVMSIGNDAFNGCSGLTAITLPSSVTSIGMMAFWECTDLDTITLNWTDPSACGCSSSAFGDITGNATLYVPEGTKSLYQGTAPWSSFRKIVEYELTGIQQHTLQADNPISAYYNTLGQRIKEPQKGQVVVVRYTDGTTRKVLVK